MAASAIGARAVRRFWWPKGVIGRFFAGRALRSSVLWGAVFGITVASSALAFAQAYTTDAARQQIAASFGNNVGLKVLLGDTIHLETVAGFTAWRALGLAVIIGAIWALLLATKTFRGEESAGRWELFLAGQTTARRAAANVLVGLGVGLFAMYVVVTAIILAVGHLHMVQFPVGASLLFGVAMVASAGIFLAVGALASQLMPTRARAAAATAIVFGVCFGLRAMADAANGLHWLMYATPLGWVELLRPLTSNHAVWLLPIAGFILVVCLFAVYLAGKRDLGVSILADHDTARPHIWLLGTPLGLTMRLTRGVVAGWFVGLTVASFAFSSLAKTAGQAFGASSNLSHVLDRLSQAQLTGAMTFLGIIFFFLTTIIMLMMASLLGDVRETEAEGYLDNLLVRAVGRLRWLLGRLLLIGIALVLAAAIITMGGWLASHLQHTGVDIGKFIQAGVNCLAPAIFVLGMGVMAFGFVPRLTTTVIYGIVAWSFLVQMIGSIGNISHWVLDTSLLHHIAFVPAADIRWDTFWMLIGLGGAGLVAGVWRFAVRDLASE